MSPVRAAPLFARIELPPLQGSSCSRPLPRPYSLGYELNVSPAGLRVERLIHARNSYEVKASPAGFTLNAEDVKKGNPPRLRLFSPYK